MYLRAGFSSLFTYCREVLGLSEDEAYNRIEAARAVRRFPAILDLLGAGEVRLTTIRLLGPHLTPENHMAVLDSARGKSKAEVEEIVARLAPRPDVPSSVRKLKQPIQAQPVCSLDQPTDGTPAGLATSWFGSDRFEGSTGGLASSAGRPAEAPGLQPVPPGSAEGVGFPMPQRGRSAHVVPLSPDRYKYQLTIGGATLGKLRLARDLLRHALPTGDDEAILDRALTALLTELVRKKVGGEPKAAPSGNDESAEGEAARSAGNPPLGAARSPAEDSRDIPAAVKRAVWARDLGRCAFLAPDGRRCGERAFVEFHQ